MDGRVPGNDVRERGHLERPGRGNDAPRLEDAVRRRHGVAGATLAVPDEPDLHAGPYGSLDHRGVIVEVSRDAIFARKSVRMHILEL
jgi:hypothetical protein